MTSLRNVHFWALDLEAFRACPQVEREYALLQLRPLTDDFVARRAVPRTSIRALMPMCDLPTMRGRFGGR